MEEKDIWYGRMGKKKKGARGNGITINNVLPAAGKLNQNVTALGILWFVWKLKKGGRVE